MTSLIMPMAGTGSRFPNDKFQVSKPYIQLHGKPLFFWATQSVLNYSTSIKNIVFVIQEIHSRKFEARKRILEFFPEARIIEIDWATSGSLETALVGMEMVSQSDPVIVNDCDHAFAFRRLGEAISLLETGALDAFLANFYSDSDAYSYAAYDSNGFLRESCENSAFAA